jgi:heat shock protein HslJ
MKKIIMALFCAAFFLPAFPQGARGAPAQEGGITFRSVEEKEWLLSEIKSPGKATVIDRKELEAANMGGFFTISFRDGRASGTGAPNRYFGPYAAGGNRSLSLGNVASTMMAAFMEPPMLKEGEYFDCLSKVARWDLREGRLELCSADGETMLVFTLSPN